MNSKKVKISKGSIVFYVFAVIFLIITAYNIYSSYDQVAQYTAQQGTAPTSDMQYNLYLTTCVPYLAYALILYGIGLAMHKIGDLSEALSYCVSDTVVEEEIEEEAIEEIADLAEENA